MITTNNILVVIPARGGSKGIPGKNIKILGDQPLIGHTIEAAKAVFPISNICVSTDDEEIKATSESYGLKVPFLRPSHLASDTSGTYEVLLHALNNFEEKSQKYNIVVLLQPTSPFRKFSHIKEALELYNDQLEMVVSVRETKSNPYFNVFEEENGYLKKSKTGDYTRRQDTPKAYEYNGAIYVINVNALRNKPLEKFTKIKKYVMDDLSSIDLDTILDWKISEFLISEKVVKL